MKGKMNQYEMFVMIVNRRSRDQSPLNEHKMIDIQYEIQKLEADLGTPVVLFVK